MKILFTVLKIFVLVGIGIYFTACGPTTSRHEPASTGEASWPEVGGKCAQGFLCSQSTEPDCFADALWYQADDGIICAREQL